MSGQLDWRTGETTRNQHLRRLPPPPVSTPVLSGVGGRWWGVGGTSKYIHVLVLYPLAPSSLLVSPIPLLPYSLCPSSWEAVEFLRKIPGHESCNSRSLGLPWPSLLPPSPGSPHLGSVSRVSAPLGRVDSTGRPTQPQTSTVVKPQPTSTIPIPPFLGNSRNK